MPQQTLAQNNGNKTMFEDLPYDLVCFNIAQYLNPRDQSCLSSTNRLYRDLFPTPLQIKIMSKSSKSALKSRFYVSRSSDPSKTLLATDYLQFGENYLFWTYDYERENRVFLGRHGQKMLHSEHPHYMFTLGLRPIEANQFWSISKGGMEGNIVPFETSVGLMVGGKNTRRHLPDSTDKMFLSAHTLTMGALWYAIQQKWGNDEHVQLMRYEDYVTSDGIVEKELIIHAIPDLIDGCYSMYSPESLEKGRAACELFHATVPFLFWIEGGMMLFQTLQTLSFSFGVPILEEDQVAEREQISPLRVLLKKNSSRWWAVKHFMSTAADISEGRGDFKLDTFLRTVKDHEDHEIIFDGSRNLVFIQVKDAIVEKNFPDFNRDETRKWEFLLCG